MIQNQIARQIKLIPQAIYISRLYDYKDRPNHKTLCMEINDQFYSGQIDVNITNNNKGNLFIFHEMYDYIF